MRPLAVAVAALFAAGTHASDAQARAAAPTRSGTLIAVTDCNEDALRAAVAGAPNEATVDLTALVGCTITLTAGEIVIAVDDLSVQGPADSSLTLSGNQASRIFHHTGTGLLSLDHLDLTDGRYTTPIDDKYVNYLGQGGAIESEGSVTLTHSSVRNSSTCRDAATAGYGGGVFAAGDVSVIHSRISGNTACGYVHGVIMFLSYDGGAGGGIVAGGNTTIAYSTIIDNRANAAGGGGVFSVGDLTVSHSTLSGNYGLRKGGGATVQGNATFMASTVSGNEALDGGGIGASYGGAVKLYDSTIAFNTASRSEPLGGGVFAGGQVILVNTIVANNTAHDIEVIGDSPPPMLGDHNVVMSSSPAPPADTIIADPGLLPLADNGGATQTHALAAGSVAIDVGRPFPGIVFDQRGTGFARTIGAAADIGAFEYGTPPSPVTDCSEAAVRAAIAGAPDGGVVDLSALSDCTITLADGPFTSAVDNLALIGPADRTLTLDGDDRDRVIAHYGGGVLTLDHIALAHGYTTGGKYAGGAVFSSGSIVLAGSSVTDSKIGGPAGNSQAFGGGGIYAQRGVTLDESVVSGNESRGRAGGICALAGDVTIRNSTIADNHSDLEGGGLFAPSCSIVCTVGEFTIAIENSTISGNSAGTNGGGAHVTYGNVTVRNSTIAANTAQDATAGGGGLFIRDVVDGVQHAPTVTIVSSIVATNTSPNPAADIGSFMSLPVLGDHDIIAAMNGTPPPDTLNADPGLLPLGNYGGPTPTHPLATGSLAIDRGSNAEHLTTDQRGDGYPRRFGAGTDIGAFEYSQPVIVDRIFGSGFD